MLVGKEHIISWLETNKTPYWYIKTGASEKAGLIFSAQNDEETLSLEDSKLKLKSCLDMLANGNYLIQAWTTPGQKKSWSSVAFQISGQAYNGTQQNTPNINGLGNGMQGVDIQAEIQKALAEERTKLKIEYLEKELVAKEAKIKELQSELDSSTHRIGSRLENAFEFFNNQLGGKSGTPPPMAGIGANEDPAEYVGNLMERWHAKDNDFVSVLNGIVYLAENNPGKYQMGKNLLK